MSQKNWRGMETHWTDQFIHWRSDETRITELRVLADRLVEHADRKILEKFLTEFRRESYEEGYDAGYDEGDN